MKTFEDFIRPLLVALVSVVIAYLGFASLLHGIYAA